MILVFRQHVSAVLGSKRRAHVTLPGSSKMHDWTATHLQVNSSNNDRRLGTKSSRRRFKKVDFAAKVSPKPARLLAPSYNEAVAAFVCREESIIVSYQS